MMVQLRWSSDKTWQDYDLSIPPYRWGIADEQMGHFVPMGTEDCVPIPVREIPLHWFRGALDRGFIDFNDGRGTINSLTLSFAELNRVNHIVTSVYAVIAERVHEKGEQL